MVSADPPPTRLVLIRHGESKVTVERVIGGFRTCTGLSDLGRQQAKRLRDRLAETGELSAGALYASNFARAQETAEIIAPALGGLDVLEEAGFGEHDPGPDCDGMTFDAFIERYGTGHNWEDPFAESFPGGETIAAFHHRVGVAAHDVLQRHAGETIVVCCHGGVINALIRQFLRMPPTGSFELQTTNCSLTEFVRGERFWRFLRYNDAAHLAGLPLETARA